MKGSQAARLPGNRLHLQHGPIDLVIGADGDTEAAFAAAHGRFATVLEELVAELPLLRDAVGQWPASPVTQRMVSACQRHAANAFVTPMAAVAGSVADEILQAMVQATPLSRAYVNNGGDIAIWLTGKASFRIAMSGLAGDELGRIALTTDQPSRGIATSGRGGRSLSMGIAESVTVLARNAASADVAATLIANATDLPGHPAITRQAARDLHPDSDLGARPVVTDVAPLSHAEITCALSSGMACARDMRDKGLIDAAALTLRGETVVVGDGIAMPGLPIPNTDTHPIERIPLHV